MKTLIVQRRELDLDQFKMRSAAESDYDTLVTESTAVYEDGDLMIAYLELDLDCSHVVQALQAMSFETERRTSGLISQSRVFGYLPRNTLRRDFCTATWLAVNQPREHAIITAYAVRVAEYYRSLNPDLYEKHQRTTDEHVVGDYRIKDSPFTSGIVNKNNPLKYHFDRGNFKDVWSCMLVFKNNVQGGYLSVPEYGLGFELKHNSLFMFDGQGLLHGVTPIVRRTPDAYRYSIVYYSMREMWNCLPVTDELIRIRNLKTERELKRLTNRTKEDFE